MTQAKTPSNERQPGAAQPPAVRGRTRVVIEGVMPQIDGGRFAIKRAIGEGVLVEADVFTDGHDVVACDLLYRHESDEVWQRLPMTLLVNDRFAAEFRVDRLGRYRYMVEAWVDAFATWQRDLSKRRTAGQDLTIPLKMGSGLMWAAARRAQSADSATVAQWTERLAAAGESDQAYWVAESQELAALMRRLPDPDTVERSARELFVTVEPERARFSAWYEFFPRSAGSDGKRHGTFRDAERMLDYVASMGFDVVYLPPIHPIGNAFRKGKNNTLTPTPEDVGSPWAIGAAEGGHKGVHPALGTPEDFRRFVAKAKSLGIEIALDIAFQCSPDHPYVGEHPEWFLRRPDGTIQYAENPPKKYQDIYPFHFETEDWPALWDELASVFEHWIGEGVTVFRVDNPHTKPFRFWERTIDRVKRAHPEVIFLSEAFTRPKVMHRLAKAGFSQSYTYFTWRNTKPELQAYFTELALGPGREYFRPNVWPNTPDILPEYLQIGGRPAFVVRYVLAATLGSSYGVYGPAFELLEHVPREPGAEEYLDSEKYELKAWDLDRADSLRDLMGRMNRIRREHRALQSDWSLQFHTIDNEQILAYSKHDPAGDDWLLVLANLDPFHPQSGFLELPTEALGIRGEEPYQVHDLLTGARYLWHGARNYIALDPQSTPAHVFRIRRRLRREQDFDYYM